MTADSRERPERRERASSPVVGAVLLVGVTVVVASVAGAAALAVPGSATGATGGGERVVIGLSAEEERLRLVHRGGPPLDVRRLYLRVRVNGEGLAHQPPVPVFAATGFRAGPGGPFNAASDPTWEAGETASLRVAGTNRPAFDPGSEVTVVVYVEEKPAARASATA